MDNEGKDDENMTMMDKDIGDSDDGSGGLFSPQEGQILLADGLILADNVLDILLFCRCRGYLSFFSFFSFAVILSRCRQKQ